MSQRIRTGQLWLGNNFPSSNANAIEGFTGWNMNFYKPATQSVTSSTAFVNDDSLWVELPSGPSRFNLYIPTTVLAAGNIKLQLVADQGLTISAMSAKAMFLLDSTAPGFLAITNVATPVSGGATNAWTAVYIDGTVNVVNKGVLQLQWAQVASNGTASQVLAGASITTTQLTAG